MLRGGGWFNGCKALTRTSRQDHSHHNTTYRTTVGLHGCSCFLDECIRRINRKTRHPACTVAREII